MESLKQLRLRVIEKNLICSYQILATEVFNLNSRAQKAANVCDVKALKACKKEGRNLMWEVGVLHRAFGRLYNPHNVLITDKQGYKTQVAELFMNLEYFLR